MNHFRSLAQSLDNQDELRKFRAYFHLPENVIYLDGNSLGALPKESHSHLNQVITDEWGNQLIKSWEKSWLKRPQQIGDQLAELLGAGKGEIIISDSTSINIYKLASAILQKSDRNVVLTDDLNFPTDIYLLQGICKTVHSDCQLELLTSPDSLTMPLTVLDKRLQNEDVALLVLSHVVFKSAFCYPMKEVNALAKKYGTEVLWDLSHSAGAIHLALHESGTDFAVGCTYKYLNGGPGSPSFIYVGKKHQATLESPIWGWFGDEQPFEFQLNYRPHPGIQKFLVGTPPILSMSTLKTSLQLFEQAGLENIRLKSVQMIDFFIKMYEEELKDFSFSFLTPRDAAYRGSHFILAHSEADKIVAFLISDKSTPAIIPDFRPPDFIRFGVAPLYNQFEEMAILVERLKQYFQ